MYNESYSNICRHDRLQRIDENFVRCMDCGQSMISQKHMATNKTSKDFTNENKSFCRNFDRNFSNVLEEVDEYSSSPLYEYYSDRMGINIIIINKRPAFHSYPIKYEVIANGSKSYLTVDYIQKMLSDINAIKIDAKKFNLR